MATYTDFSDVHTNLARPKNSAILTVRVIKSFQYRTERSLVLKDINLETTTVGQLKDISRQAIQIQSGWKPYRNVELGKLLTGKNSHKNDCAVTA
ncbi:hypothetical protein DFH05DRAFT_1503675 [Lentinula detonsa]|uniref:Uncharacterized protein n=1 Tax=Lentinula detonsa TaxID=2804962 RepID=A0A9W8NW38_9AGAR|nr:hypothetical protein DFH05DRAFT_1503675 [Lentinula detonsa]